MKIFDNLSSIKCWFTTFICIITFLLLDAYGFFDIDPVNNYQVDYPLTFFSENQGQFSALVTHIHPLSHFMKSYIWFSSNISQIYGSINYFSNGFFIQSENITISLNNSYNVKTLIKSSRKINFDQVHFLFMCQSTSSQLSSKIHVYFLAQIGSYSALDRDLFIRGSFFILSLSFMVLYLKNFFTRSSSLFHRICSLSFLILAFLATNPFLILLNNISAELTNILFKRLFFTISRYVLFVRYLISPQYFAISLIFIFDLIFSFLGDGFFVLFNFLDPTNTITYKPQIYDILFFIMLIIEVIFIVLFAFFWKISKGKYDIFFNFIILSLNELITFISRQKYNKGLLYIISFSIPTIFACYNFVTPINVMFSDDDLDSSNKLENL